jgi:amidohydrolase
MNIEEYSSIKEYVTKMRRYFHANPELSEKEFETSRRIKEELDKMDIQYVCAGKLSIVASINGELPGGVVALRADMDALPIEEKNDCSYKSTVANVMHACGHDAHIAMLLGAAKVLIKNKDKINGVVKLIFQESEEVLLGAKRIVEEGHLNDVDAILGLHVDPKLDLGITSLQEGPFMTAGGGIEIRVKGSGGGHASLPEETVNPVVVTSAILNNMLSIKTTEIGAEEVVTITPTIINSGKKSNIIPAEGYLYFNWRYFDAKFEKILYEKACRIANNTSAMYGASSEVEFIIKTHPLVNDNECCELLIEAAKDVLQERASFDRKQYAASEDFSFYTQKIPGVFAFIGAKKLNQESKMLHHECFDINEDVLPIGVGLYVKFALKFLDQRS